MKNRKFIGSDLESCGWDIQTYISQIFDGEPQFWAEFTYSSGHQIFSWNLEETKKLVTEMTKFINEATKAEAKFKEKHKAVAKIQQKKK